MLRPCQIANLRRPKFLTDRTIDSQVFAGEVEELVSVIPEHEDFEGPLVGPLQKASVHSCFLDS